MRAERPGGVWPDHVPAVEAFLAVSDQWRTASTPKGIRFLGLDAAAAGASLGLSGIEISPGNWTRVRVIAGAACDALNGR